MVSRDVKPEVTMFIDGGNLVWAMPDGLQFPSKFLLKGFSLIHDKVFNLKCDIWVPTFRCILELFVPGHNQIVVVYHVE